MSKFDWNTNDINLPEQALIIPTVDVVLFPKMVVPLLVVDKNVIAALTNNEKKLDVVVLVASKINSKENSPKKITKNEIHKVGTACKIIRMITLIDGTLKIVVQGLIKVSLNKISDKDATLWGSCSVYEFENGENQVQAAEILAKEILSMLDTHPTNQNSLGSDFQFILSQIHDPERLVDFIISNIGLDVQSAQKLLEKTSITDLLDSTKQYFKAFLEKSAIKEDVKTSARNSINKSQREYFLREQLRAIKKELGEQEDSENDDLKNKIEEVSMSSEAKEEARRQFRRLERMSPDSLEAVVIRNHLEWLVNMPWNIFVNDATIDIKKAKTILDSEHFGLTAVKDKILDHLSVQSFKSKYHSQILCLAGPPGIGKTSIGRSIAKSLGRKFGHISLGGVHDESEIRGHRRTYVGALPGRLIQSIRKAGSCNPVIIIDEIDKIGASGRGDPASALLEVLDPEQNANFYDNYLGVNFDLSHVMFIATCNDLSAIPGPLRDRLEIIQMSGYSSYEKQLIASRYLLPRILHNMGLEERGILLNEEVLSELIKGYTRESGVRELDRILAKLCSKYARSILEIGEGIEFTKENIPNYLGLQKTRRGSLDLANKIGVTNGLAWTACGGEFLQVEAVLMPGTGKLILTGQLGEVMKESAQAAISYARSRAKDYQIEEKMFCNYDLHVHIPAGAIPKDGPSAGVTLLSSILSVFTQRPVDSRCAMTGELNLQGSILPVGGLREKILTAQQYGLKMVFLPEQNRKDIEQEATEVDFSGIELHFVRNVEELLSRVLL